MGKFKYTVGIALTCIEIWVESWLEQWFNRPTKAQNRFEILSRFYEDYQNQALGYYNSEKGLPNGVKSLRLFLTVEFLELQMFLQILLQDQELIA